MRVKRRDAEQWMSHRLLPDGLRVRIRRYEQYKWQETRGVDEDNLVRNLPKDLRRDIKRHLCLALLMRVSVPVPFIGFVPFLLLSTYFEFLTFVEYLFSKTPTFNFKDYYEYPMFLVINGGKTKAQLETTLNKTKSCHFTFKTCFIWLY